MEEEIIQPISKELLKSELTPERMLRSTNKSHNEIYVGIAAALDKPQIALFGASWVDKWRPYSEQAEVIYAGDYAELPHPDSIDTNDPTRLLKAIPLQDVWDKILAKLEALEA